MQTTHFLQKAAPLTFRRFSRKGYALHACLGREVRIGVLTAAMLATAAPALEARNMAEADTLRPTEAADAGSLDEAVVQASRAPLQAAVAARLVTTLQRQDLAAAGVTTLNDVLKLAAGVDVRQRGAFGMQTDISIDGGTFDQMALLINGISVTNPQTGHNAADFPIDIADIERVEVLRGAAVAPDGTLLWNGETLTAETLRSEIDIAIARRGGCAAGTIAAPGRQGADPHCVGFGPIRAGEPIVLDVFPRSRDTGYYGDLTRTLAKGAVPEEVRRAFATVQEAQQLAFGAIRAGVPGRDPHLAVARLFEERGYETSTATPAHGFFHGLGHSIGLDIHESPSLSPRNARPLEAGNVVTVEPGLYYPEWGGIRIEDDVLVTEDGCERLSSFPVFLEL